MKAITISEPWASLIAYGDKKVETRPWKTEYRGKIAIHAAKSSKVVDRPQDYNAIPPYLKLMYHRVEKGDMPEYMRNGLSLGCIIAIADLVDCRKIIQRKRLTICRNDKEEIILENAKIILEGDIEIDGISEYDLGDYTLGRYAWIFENAKRIDPIPVIGKQKLWNLPNEVKLVSEDGTRLYFNY